MPWWGVSQITWESGNLALVVAGKDESGTSWTFKVPLKSHAEAVGWIVKEALDRIPKVVDIPDERAREASRREPARGNEDRSRAAAGRRQEGRAHRQDDLVRARRARLRALRARLLQAHRPEEVQVRQLARRAPRAGHRGRPDEDEDEDDDDDDERRRRRRRTTRTSAARGGNDHGTTAAREGTRREPGHGHRRDRLPLGGCRRDGREGHVGHPRPHRDDAPRTCPECGPPQASSRRAAASPATPRSSRAAWASRASRAARRCASTTRRTA